VGITDLIFLDLRHEAVSRMFASGMKIHEAMAVSGHRTVRKGGCGQRKIRPPYFSCLKADK
jgi:hypothetical protein